MASLEESYGASVRPYVLAGGLSSRMGTDKAMLKLGGRTLLRRAVDTLRSVPALAGLDGKVTVTIVGERTEWEGADRSIEDRHARCGPLGGIEAALSDLAEGAGADWAFFMPVDMPFLPSGLIDALVWEWMEAGKHGARVCWVEVDGKIQPLVSMVHRFVHPFTVEALTAGCFKVTPVLQSAAEVLASPSTDGIDFKHSVIYKALIEQEGLKTAVAGWTATAEQEHLKRLWFSNLNSEDEFRDAETFLSRWG